MKQNSNAKKSGSKAILLIIIILLILTIIIDLQFTQAQAQQLLFLSVEKPYYELGEKVTLIITANPLSDYDLSISSENRNYKYSGELISNIDFVPSEQGSYLAELTDKQTKSLADSIEFLVGAPQLITPVETTPPSTTPEPTAVIPATVEEPADTQSTGLISTDKKTYVEGETVQVQVFISDTKKYRFYYGFQGVEQRYMGDYTSLSFNPVGIGSHYLVLRDQAYNEIEKYFFEIIEAPEQEQPTEQPSQPAQTQEPPVLKKPKPAKPREAHGWKKECFGDGTCESTYSLGINSYLENNQWIEIDTAFEIGTVADEWKAEKNVFKTNVNKNKVKITGEDNSEIGFDVPASSAPVVNDNVITYDLSRTLSQGGINYYIDAVLNLTLYEDRLEKMIVINDFFWPTDFNYNETLDMDLANGRFIIGDLSIWDSAGNTYPTNWVYEGDEIKLSISKAWLDNAAYPVYIDPTVYYNYSDSTNNKAYKLGSTDFQDGATVAWADGWSATLVEASGDYSALSADGGGIANSPSGAAGKDAVWRFDFTVNEDTALMNWMYFHFNGYEDSNGETGRCYVANFSGSGTWDYIGDINKGSEADVTKNFTSDFDDLINASDKMSSIYCYGDDFDTGGGIEYVYADFVQIITDYTSDTTIPVVNINESLNNTETTDTTPGINFNHTDDKSSTANCTLYFNGTGYGTTNNINNYTDTTITASPALSTGRYDVWVNCTDLYDNEGKSSVLNISVDGGPIINLQTATPQYVINNTAVNISANVTKGLVGVDKVIARIYDSNGTSVANYTMTNVSGTIFWNASYAADFGTPGLYNVTIFANETNGVSNTVQVNFTPILNLSKETDIVINGVLTDWSGASVPVISDVVGDAGAGGPSVDNELLITGLNDDPGNITIFAYNVSGTGKYESVWSTDTTDITDPGVDSGIAGGEIGDVNHDGVNDFVIQRYNGSYLLEVWTYNSSNQEWYRLWLKKFTSSIFLNDVGDFDGDNKDEIYITNRAPSPDAYEIWGNDTVGATTFALNSTVKTFTVITYARAAGDMDGDNVPELIIGPNGGGSKFQIYEHNGSAYEWLANVTVPEYAGGGGSMTVDDMECSHDVNNDTNNNVDCIVCGNSNAVHVLTYTGSAYTIDFNSTEGGDYSQTCSVADVTNDGYPDFFDVNVNAVRLWSKQGGTYKSIWNSTSQSTYSDVAVSFAGDSDNDGKGEFLAGDRGTGVRMFENNSVGATTFNNSFTWSTTTNAQHIIIGDLDSDAGGGGGTNFDIANYSLAHNATYLFARIAVNGSIDLSDASMYYAVYLSYDSSTGNATSLGGATLPFKYDYRLQINGSSYCGIWNSTNDKVGTCDSDNNSNTIELRANLTLINTTTNDIINITFETGTSGTTYDFAPDTNSFLEYKATGNTGPEVTGIDISPDYPKNNTAVNVSATVIDTDGVSTVTARFYYPNGTSKVNYTMTNTSGSVFWNASFTPDFTPSGTYSVRIHAVDGTAKTTTSALNTFSPILNLTNVTDIAIDGTFTDWSQVVNVSDIVGDSDEPGPTKSLTKNTSYNNNPDIVMKKLSAPTLLTSGASNDIDVIINVTNGNNAETAGLTWSVNVTLWNTTKVNNLNLSNWNGITLQDSGVIDCIAAADIDGDGDPDLITSQSTAVRLWENPDGSLNISEWNYTQESETGTVYAIGVGDFDDDGDSDIITGTGAAAGDIVYLWENPGGEINISKWNNTNFTLADPVYDVAVGDLDNDGDLDIGATSSGLTYDGLSVIINPGSEINISKWNTTNTSLGSVGPGEVYFGDFDGDGDLDIVVNNGSQFVIYENPLTTTNVSLWNSTSTDTNAGVDGIAVGDLDGDGDLDITGGNSRLFVFENPGGEINISKWNVTNVTVALNGVTIGDLDNDGDNDIITASSSSGLYAYENPGGGSINITQWNRTNVAVTGFTFELVAVDIDNDGDLDIAEVAIVPETDVAYAIYNNSDIASTYITSGVKTFTNQSGNASTYSLSWTPTATGNYTLMAIADNSQQIGEVLECNNKLVMEVNVTSTGSGGNDYFDLKVVSLANNNTYLFARIAVNGTVDLTDGTKYYGLYVSTNSSTGNSTSYKAGATLPFSANYFVMVNGTDDGTGCSVFNSAYTNLGDCNASNSSSQLEIRVNLTLINSTTDDIINITFETGGSSYDFAPDTNSFLEYKVNASGTGPTPDTTAPTVNINTSLDNSFTKDSTPVVNFNFTDAKSPQANCTLFFGGNDLDATLNTNNDTWTDLTVNTSQSDGSYSVYVNCTDNATNEGKSSVITIVIDNVAPTVNVEVPADDNWSGSASPDFVFNFTDALSSSANCTLWVDGSQEDVNATTTNDTSTTLSASGLSESNHTWSVNCTDSAGNTGVIVPRNITVDATAPSVSPTSPDDNSWVTDTTPDFVFSVTDNLDYRLNCILWVDGANKGSNASTMNDTSTTITSTELTEASHTWEINCSDEVGNEGSIVDRTIYVDNTVPTVNINESLDELFTLNTQPVVQFNFTDGVSSTANCTLYVDGTGVNATLDTSNNSWTDMKVNTSLGEANHSVWVNCTDKAGKEGKSTVINIIVDTTAPGVTPSTPGDNAWTNDTTPDFTFTVTDVFSDRLNCILYVDDSNEGSNASTMNNTATTITSNALSEASHSWVINCTDNASNEGTMVARTLYVDDTNPTVNINSSWDNVVTNNNQPVIQFNFTDALSSTANCTLYFDAAAVNATLDTSNNSWTDMKVNTSQSDANYSVYVNCTDKAENEAKSSVLNIEIDTSVPLVYNVINWSIDSSSAKVNWTTDEPANGTVTYGTTKDLLDGSQTHSTFLNNHSLSLSGLDSSQIYYYNITSCDELQQCNISGPYNFTTEVDSDTTAPVVNINTSLDEWFTTNTQPVIEFNFTDAGSSAANCTLYFGGSALNATLNTNNDTWTDMKVNTSQSDGNFSVYVNCTDNADNEGKSSVINIIIDNVAPTVNVEVPADDNWSGSASPDFVFNFSDSLSPGANCTLWVDGSQEDVNASTTNDTSTTLSASGLSESNHTWSVNCTDSAGNTGVIVPRNITVDTSAPGVTPSSPDDNAWTTDTTPNFIFTTTDALDYRLNCILWVDGANKGSNASTMNDTSTTITSTELTEASHTWEINCSDEVGNEGSIVDRTLYVDNTVPTIDINESLNNTVSTTDTPIINFNFTDSVSSTANCTLFFDTTDVNASNDVANKTWTDMLVNTSQSDGNFSVYVNCTDKAGKIGKSGVLNIEIDTIAPPISGVINWSITHESAIINWTTTEDANGTVIYGEDTDMTDGSQTHSTYLFNHTLTLSSLTNDTLYYYNITSCDAQGLCNTTGPYNFTTISPPASLEVNVTVDAINYLAGSVVNASGTFFWSNGTKISSKNVTVKFYNTTDVVIDEKNVTTDANGIFWSNYTLLDTDEDGTWTVNVTGIWNSTNRTDENTTTFDVNKTITILSPAAGTNVDRDDTGADEDNATLVARLNDGSSGVNVFFKANLTEPTIDGETNIVIWNASTNSSGEIAIIWNGTDNNTDKMYAGNYTWWVEAANYDLVGSRDIQLYGTLNLTFRYDAQDPNTTYDQGDTVIIDAFLGSYGPETRTQLNSTYSGAVNSTLEDPDPAAHTVVLTDPGEDEEPVRAYGKTAVNQEASVEPVVEDSQTEKSFLLNLIEKIFGKELETKTAELFTPLYASPDGGESGESIPVKTFDIKQNPDFEFDFDKNFNVFKYVAQVFANPTDAELIKDGEVIEEAELEIKRQGFGKYSVKVNKARQFKPGLYTLRFDYDGEIQEEEFLWGVLAINTHKSIYLPNEEAFIGIAVLDNEGRMVCDADVTLEITNPEGIVNVLSTGDGSIVISPECNVYAVTNLPDYYAYYNVGAAGNYTMNLTAITFNGARSFVDNFVVQDSVEFDVERSGPTRIYPLSKYFMNFTIKANQDYSGLIIEYVPASFEITPQSGLNIATLGNAKALSWDADMTAGSIYTFNYEFDAPDISPYLFTLGPLEIGTWKEAREWMIASDAIDPVTVIIPTVDPDIDINGNFRMNCSMYCAGSCSNVNLNARYNTSSTAWADIGTTTGLNTSDTNPLGPVTLGNKETYYGSWNVTGRTDDVYNIRCISGAVLSAEIIQVTVSAAAGPDTTAPTVNINTSLDEWFTSNQQPVIEFNFTDAGSSAANCTLYFGGSALNATLNTNNNTWTDMKVNTSQSDGNFSVYVNCTDNASNEGKSTVIDIIVDATAPSVSPSSPDAGNWTWDNTTDFTFTVTDSFSGRLNCILYVDNVNKGSNASTMNNTATTITSTELTDGSHTWEINCTDNASNEATMADRSITVDAKPPSVSPTSPGDNAWVSDTTPDFIFTTTDSFSARLNCILWVDAANKGSNSTTMNDTATTITSTELTEASHSWTVNCTDNVTNTGFTTARTLYVDNTAPTVNINESLNNTVFTTGTPIINFNFTDSLSSTSNCTLYFDTTDVNASNDVANKTWIDMKVNTSQNDGNYSVYVNCTDKAGKIGKSSVLNIEIDTTAPAISAVVNWSITYNSAKINWTTVEPANGTVIYGQDTDMTDGSQTHSSFLNNHSLSLSSLTSSKLYYYNITSCDESAQCNTTGPYNFTTPGGPDETVPTVNINTSLDEFFTTNQQPVVQFNFTDARSPAANCTLYFGGSALNATLNTNNNTWTDMKVNTSQSDGNFSVYVNCTDNASNEGKSALVDIIIDTGDPSVSPSSPDDNNWTSDTTPDFTFTVTDSFSARLNCTLWVDGTVNGTNASTMNNTATTVTSSGLGQGSHTWTINCTDDASNVGATTARTITIDSNSPTVGVTNPGDNLWTTDTTPDFVFAVNDSIDSLLNCSLWVDGSSEANNATTTNNTITTFAGVSLSEATHTWTINCTDNASNIGYSAERTLNIDNTVPTVNINISLNNTATSLSAPRIDFNFSDSVSGTANCTLYINSTAYNYTTDINNNTLTNLTSNTSLIEGRYDIYVNCTDKAGKIGKSKVLNMTVDAGYVITSPPAGTNFKLESDSSKNATEYGQNGEIKVLVGLDSTTGNYSGIIVFNFTADIDVSKLVIDTNRSSRKSVIHNSSELSDSVVNVSLLIPRVVDSNNVYICPDAISIAQVNTSCPSKVTMTTGQTLNGMTVSEVTYDSEDYYLVENITGTGGGEGDVKHWNGTYVTDAGDTTGEWNVSLNAVADWFYSSSLNDTRNFTLSAVGANDPPTVDTVSSVSSQTPNAGTTKRVEVNFTVTDTDGTGNLNHSSAKAEFTNGSTTRSGGCNYTIQDTNIVEYNCSVNMQYYDPSGTWAINMSIRDNPDASAYNATTEFTYGTLLYIQVSPVVFGFGDFYPGEGPNESVSNPLQIDNMGNVNLTQINITAYNLVNGSYTIGASNITVNISDAIGTSLSDSTEINIPEANVTVDVAGADANESLYFYITIPNVRPLSYISSSSWVIEAGE